MDAGCYTVNLLRYVIGTEPTQVTAATCERAPDRPHVDTATEAELVFPSPDGQRTVRATLCASLNSSLWSFLSAPFTLKVQSNDTMHIIHDAPG